MFEIKQIIFDSNCVYLYRLILSQIYENEKIDIDLTHLVDESYNPVCYEAYFVFNDQKYYAYVYSNRSSIAENQKRIVYDNLDLSNNYILISLNSFSSFLDNENHQYGVTYFVYIFLITENTYRLKSIENFYKNFEKESNLPPHDEFLFPRYNSISSEFELVGFGYKNDDFKIYIRDVFNTIFDSTLEGIFIKNDIIDKYRCYYSFFEIRNKSLSVIIAENNLLYYLKKNNKIDIEFISGDKNLQEITIPITNSEKINFNLKPLSKELFILFFSNERLDSLVESITKIKLDYLFKENFKTANDYKQFINEISIEDMHRLEAEGDYYEDPNEIDRLEEWNSMDDETQQAVDMDRWLDEQYSLADRQDKLNEEINKEYEEKKEKIKQREIRFRKAGILDDITILSIKFLNHEDLNETEVRIGTIMKDIPENDNEDIDFFNSNTFIEVIYLSPNSYAGDSIGISIFTQILEGVFIGKLSNFIYIFNSKRSYIEESTFFENYFGFRFTLLDEIKDSETSMVGWLCSDFVPLTIYRSNIYDFLNR